MALSATVQALTRRELRTLVALFVLTLPAVTSRLYSSDEVQYFSYLRSLWFDRDVSFDNEYRHFYDLGVARTPGFEQTFLQPLTATGLRENFGTLGCAILWAPFYALADLATAAVNAMSGDWVRDGYSRPYIAAVAYGSAFYGFAALLLSIAAARRLTGDGVITGVAVWFGTPLFFYMYIAPPFSHAPSAFAVALFVTVWLRVRERWSPKGLVALGAAAALMTMVREQDVFYTVGPAVDFAITIASRLRNSAAAQPSDTTASIESRGWSSAGRALLGAAAGVAAFLIVYSPQLFAYLALNGRPGPSTLVTRKMKWMAPHALGVLASPQHGLFAWTPLAALAVVGLVLLWARTRGNGPRTRLVFGCLVLMFLMQVYVSGSVDSWTVAGAFGQRRFVGATILFVIGLAAIWQRVPAGPARNATAAFMALTIWWNLGLLTLFGTGWMNRQQLTLRQNAYDVFVTLPREAPGLVYRYFFDRTSFYKSTSGER